MGAPGCAGALRGGRGRFGELHLATADLEALGVVVAAVVIAYLIGAAVRALHRERSGRTGAGTAQLPAITNVRITLGLQP